MTAEEVRGLLQGALEYAKFPVVQAFVDGDHKLFFLKDHDADSFSIALKDGSRFAVIVHAVPQEWTNDVHFKVDIADRLYRA